MQMASEVAHSKDVSSLRPKTFCPTIATRRYGLKHLMSATQKGKKFPHLEHGLQDHGVALDNLAQGDELGVGAQEVQRSTPCCATRAWGRLHSKHDFYSQVGELQGADMHSHRLDAVTSM